MIMTSHGVSRLFQFTFVLFINNLNGLLLNWGSKEGRNEQFQKW